MDDLKELLGKVTPGPWFIDGIAVSGDGLDVCFMGEPAQCAGDTANMLLNYDDNARLIAMAPDLAAEVLRLRAEVERLTEALVTLNGPDWEAMFTADEDW